MNLRDWLFQNDQPISEETLGLFTKFAGDFVAGTVEIEGVEQTAAGDDPPQTDSYKEESSEGQSQEVNYESQAGTPAETPPAA